MIDHIIDSIIKHQEDRTRLTNLSGCRRLSKVNHRTRGREVIDFQLDGILIGIDGIDRSLRVLLLQIDDFTHNIKPHFHNERKDYS